MAMDFPASPTLNQVFGAYTWDGVKWINTASTQTLNGTGQIVGTTGAVNVSLKDSLDIASTTIGPLLSMSKAAGSNANIIQGKVSSTVRWAMMLGDNSTESGSNAGTDFSLSRYADGAGALLDYPLAISRATGQATFTQPINAPNIGYRNRLINGDFRIDQWNNFATITPTTGQFVCDRWRVGLPQASKISTQVQAQSVGDASLTGIANHLYVTTILAYTPVSSEAFVLKQPVEWINLNDLSWGTIYAQPVTLTFWAVSSITGTHSGALQNAVGNRSYPFSFNIANSGSKTKFTVTIPGDTTGTWAVANSALGMVVSFSLGCGPTASGAANAWAAGNFPAVTGAVKVVQTNGAYLQITGVQLEAGSAATAFELRPYDQELRMCQRYYVAGLAAFLSGWSGGASMQVSVSVSYPVPMRTVSTTFVAGAASNSGPIPATNSIAVLSPTICVVYCISTGTGAFVLNQQSFSVNAEL